MAAPQKSRWAWMSQAVASVESGLDKILADEEEDTKAKAAPKAPARVQEETSAGTVSARASTELKRSDSDRAKADVKNDRLQARLAQAMAKKSPTPSRPLTPQPQSQSQVEPDSELQTVPNAVDQGRVAAGEKTAGSEAKDGQDLDQAPVQTLATDAADTPVIDVIPAETPTSVSVPPHDHVAAEDSLARDDTTALVTSSRPSVDSVKLSSEIPSRTSTSGPNTEHDAQILRSQLEHEKSLAELQKEVDGYLERIDALQRNLQTLTRETIQNAKTVKTDSNASAADKELAAKDEKIAALIEEGTKLTKNELQYRNTIKKLRTEAAVVAKDQAAVGQRAEKAEKTLAVAQARAVKAEAETKRLSTQVTSLTKSSTELQAIAKERNALQSTLAEVRAQLAKSDRRAEEAEARAQSDKLDAERRRVAELQDDLGSAKIERELAEDKLKREIEDLRQSLAREKQQSRQMETEMLAEQAVLESKLEAYRLRAEEVSSGDQTDSQAKLLRQIETLQSQSSAASSNWQGIETSLLARITAVERERDEVATREADVRRKLREATSKAKSATRELERLQESVDSVHDQQDRDGRELQAARKHVSSLEQSVADLQKELHEQKTKFDSDLTRRIDEERAKWAAYVPASTSRVESPAASFRKPPATSLVDTISSPFDRPTSRRSSAYPAHEYTVPSPRMNSTASFRTNGHLETPSLVSPDEHDEYFANVPATPASMTNAGSAGRLHEVISASTAAAGPSVQLVERLSTTVRRLESEKAASKDELARLSSQRDESRQEVVTLMRELDSMRETVTRLTALEREHATLSTKHDETLELLGEKSEQVEELKADIADVKQMYRHLADTMGK